MKTTETIKIMNLVKTIKITRLFLLVCLFSSSTLHATTQSLDRIIAVVDDDVVLNSELEQRMSDIKKQLAQNHTATPPEQILHDQVLERLIQESIQLQMAERMGMRIDDNALNEAIGNIARQNNMTTEQFQQATVQDGIPFARIREQIRHEMIISQLRQKRVGGRIQISEQDIKNFFASETAKTEMAADYRLSHILISLTENPTEEQRKQSEQKALDVYKQAAAGADFKELAIRYSEAQNALEGGDLGWRPAAQLPTLFADVVVNMRKNDVSKPISSPSGFHIIKVTDMRGGTEHVVPQTLVRHILIKPNEIRTPVAAKQLINEISARLAKGEKFEELAKTYSNDPGSARNGGDLGWTNPGSMVKQFEETMNKMAIHQVSAPFETQFGWHILEVQNRRNQDMSEEFKNNQARNILFKRKFEEELDTWMREIRQDAYVDIKK